MEIHPRDRGTAARQAVAVVLLVAGLFSGAVGAADDKPASAKERDGLPGVSNGLIRAFEDRAATGRSAAPDGAERGMRADVVLDPGLGVPRAALERAGVRVVAVAARHGRASVVVPDRAALERLAAVPGVRMVAQEFGYRRRAGLVDSRAVEVLNVDAINAASAAGLTGNGVTVGILSDSISRTEDTPGDPGVVDGDTLFDGMDAGTGPKTSPVTMTGSRPQDDGELPAQVEILRDDDSGSVVDEGAAMAELVHDIAPGAGITFHTATAGGIAGFADAIDTICAPGSGVDVVVDDIGFIAELMYQRDPISRAAEDCVARGVPLFSAAGNIGRRGFREAFDDLQVTDDAGRTTVFPPLERDFHDWSGGNGYLEVEVPANSKVTAVLQWNQPALSVPGNNANGPRIDLDLLAFSSPSPFDVITTASSVIDQRAGTASAGQDPVEVVQLSGGSGGAAYYLAVDHWAGAQEEIPQDNGTRLEFRLVFYESGQPSNIQYLDSPGGPSAAPTMYGHTVADGVLSVGAVPWYDAAPYLDAINAGPTGDIDPQRYSSLGGALERHFRPDGRFRRATQPPQPAIAATDGNNTSFFGQPWPSGLDSEDGEDDGNPNFFGTSAAAPNAAAVAALLLQYDPALAPAALAGKLQTSAVDVTGRNAGAGCDPATGSGLLDAGAALSAADDAPVADAGSDRTVDAGETVTLDGNASRDDRFVNAYRWRQVAGPRVSLTSAGNARTDFEVPSTNATLVFELRVQDVACLSDADRVAVRAQSDTGGGGGGALGGTFVALLALLAGWLHGMRRGSRDGAIRAQPL